MSVTLNQKIHSPHVTEIVYTTDNITTLTTALPALLPDRMATHHARAGLNPIVDAASHLFSVVGKLQHLTDYDALDHLQTELIREINRFQENVQRAGYHPEYAIVCRYIVCATLDETISQTMWGQQGKWDDYALLRAFNQDPYHHDKFFSIMERAIKEPAVYIDLMELMYLCLSMGYKGQYRTSENGQHLLEQITNSLYKHIRAFRGSFSKILSPTPLKAAKPPTKTPVKRPLSLGYLCLVTACIIMGIFISLGYLMDVISNEAYQTVTTAESLSQ